MINSIEINQTLLDVFEVVQQAEQLRRVHTCLQFNPSEENKENYKAQLFKMFECLVDVQSNEYLYKSMLSSVHYFIQHDKHQKRLSTNQQKNLFEIQESIKRMSGIQDFKKS